MIFNTRKLVKVALEDLTLHIKPLDAMQQAEVLDLVADAKDHKATIKVAELAIGYAIEKIEGLTDEDGNEIDIKVSGCLGLPFGVLQEVLSAVINAGRLEEKHAKKS